MKLVPGSGFRIQGLRSRAQGSWLRVRGPGFRVQGAGIRDYRKRLITGARHAREIGFDVQDARFGVWGSGFGFRVSGVWCLKRRMTVNAER